MGNTLERAFAEAARLPEDEQDWLAAWILEEIASEQRWEELFARSDALLDTLVEEALAEDEAGKTLPLAFRLCFACTPIPHCPTHPGSGLAGVWNGEGITETLR